jgi:hypothetical protein
MQKIALLLLPLIFIACDKTFDEIIDSNPNNYQVTSVSPVDSFTYSPNDPLITIRIVFSISSEVSNVFCDVIASDETRLNESPIQLLDTGNNRFSNNFPLSESYPNGMYDIRYYVQNPDQTLQQVAIGSFKFNNGQTNIAPIISNLVAPDTVAIGSDTTFIFVSIDVQDDNGLNDIAIVFFNSFLPDENPSSQNPIQLFDDGTNGDLVPGDGTYSLIVILPPTGVTRGTFRWEFEARDRGNKSSNIIIHFLEVI